MEPGVQNIYESRAAKSQSVLVKKFLTLQPKHIIWQFSHYIYQSKNTHWDTYKRPNKFKFYVNTVMPHSTCTSSLVQTVKRKCHLYTKVNFYNTGIMWINSTNMHLRSSHSVRCFTCPSHIHYCKNIKKLEWHLQEKS